MGYTTKHNRINKRTSLKMVQNRATPITQAPFLNSFKDKRCFILAGGPSLLGFDFKSIENEFTIGINKAFTTYPCTVNYSMDGKFYTYLSDPGIADSERKEVHEKWLAYKGQKVFLHNNSKHIVFDPSIFVVNRIHSPAISFDISKGIYGGDNSGVGALMLAIALGANPIYLLGLDLKLNYETNTTHWHNGYPKQNRENLEANLIKYKATFESLAPLLEQAGITVINLNENSGTDCFKKQTFSNIQKVESFKYNEEKEQKYLKINYNLKQLNNIIIESPSNTVKRIEAEDKKKRIEKKILSDGKEIV